MAGGFAMYALLATAEACESCKRYASEKTLLNSATTDTFCAVLEDAQIRLPEFVDDAKDGLGDRPLAGISLFLFRCPQCEGEWFRPAVVYRTRDSQQTTRLRRYAVDAELSKALPDSAARSQKNQKRSTAA
jgi:hypothetical protein